MKNRRGRRRENKVRNRERVSNTATLDPSVASYDPQGSYGESILVTLPAHSGRVESGTDFI